MPSGPVEQDPYERAREICQRQLGHAARTRHQLADAMRRRGVEEEVATDVLRRFEAVGLIDDEAFAAAWVDSRHRGRGIGPRKIAHELRNRGVTPALVSAAIERITPDAEHTAARTLIERRLADTKDQPATIRARRLVGLLARKGYSPAVAYEVVREVLAGEDDEFPDVVELLPDDT